MGFRLAKTLSLWLGLLVVVPLLLPQSTAARIILAEDRAFEQLWQSTDGQRSDEQSWLWGPQRLWQTQERYAESPRELRWVRYYAKARMEISDPKLSAKSPWYITNGLLVVELVTGRLQIGNAAWREQCVNGVCGSEQAIAGDAVPANRAPRYRDWAEFLTLNGSTGADLRGQPVTNWLTHETEGVQVWSDSSLAERYPETSGSHRDEVTGQTVPAVLWNYVQTQAREALYVFGRPISPAFWTQALVDGVEREVLVQLFERRTLTYTPSNPHGWQVEMGNVGQHALEWRYDLRPWDYQSLHVTMLTYHYISENPNPADRLRESLSVAPAEFKRQLEYLQSHHFHMVSLDQVLAAQRGELSLPEHPVVITIDDGYRDLYQQAFPIAQSLNVPITAYIPSALVGEPAYVNWQQLQELSQSPLVTIGSHTRVHADLGTLDRESQWIEIADSKRELEAHLGIAIEHFCYPYGRYNALTMELVREAGYRSATTTRQTTDTANDDPLIWNRITISGRDSFEDFVAKLERSQD